MSLRSAIRIAARQRSFPASASATRSVISRRAASTSSSSSASHGTSSNTPWLIGSVAVFGSMTAYILTPTSEKSHVAHQHNPAEPRAPAEIQYTSQEIRDEADKKPIEVRQKATGGKAPNPGKEVDEDVKDSTTTNSLIGGLVKSGKVGNDKTQEDIDRAANAPSGQQEALKTPTKTDAPQAAATEGDKSSEKGEGGDKSGNSGSESGSSSEEAPTPNVDDSDAPDNSEIKSAIKRGERSNAPLVTMDQEAKGMDPQAGKDKEE